MIFATAPLGEVAPARPISLDREPEELVWQVTLDHIEADTGILLKKEMKPFAKAGSSTHAFDDRHVLYSKLRPYLNKVLVPDEEGIGTTELVPMLPDPERLDRDYLAHYLMTKRFVSWITEHSSGAKMPRATMADFWAHEIPVPPLAEQKRIAAILDKADAIRRKRKEAIELADQFLRSVFLDLFGDPVTNPKGLDKEQLGNLIKVASGNGLTVSQMDKGGTCAVYGGNGISGRHSEFMFRDPEIVIGRVGVYCGVVHITEPKSWVTDNALYIKEYLKPLNQDYLAEALKVARLNQYAGQAAQPLVSGSRIYPVEILAPPPDLVEQFSKAKAKIAEITQTLGVASFNAGELFDSLSQKAFAGKL